MQMRKKRLSIWASGNGTLAEAIFRYFEKASSEIETGLLITNNPAAPAVEKARSWGVPAACLNLQDAEDVRKTLTEFEIDFIILAGFLKKVPSKIISAYPNKIANVHPALLPKFGGKGMYGAHVHEAVLAAGEIKSGFTLHFVNENYDEGAIIYQMITDVYPHDTPQMLQTRVQALEREYVPPILSNIIRSYDKITQ